MTIALSRRQFLKGFLSCTVLGAAGGFYAVRVEPYWVEDVPVSLPLVDLPGHLNGKTLVQMSDLHVGNRADPIFLQNELERVRRLEPDFVVYTGDFVTYESATQIEQLRAVMAYAPLGRLGTAAVLGNHDYGYHWKDNTVADQVSGCLEALGISVLRNEKRVFSGLGLIGIDDYWSPNYAPEKALRQQAYGEPAVVLCHNPDVADEPVWDGYRGWILAGHTHGGQCRLPFMDPPVLPVKNKRYVAGRYDLDGGRILYINRGLGHSLPVRLNVRPEVTVFTLQNAMLV